MRRHLLIAQVVLVLAGLLAALTGVPQQVSAQDSTGQPTIFLPLVSSGAAGGDAAAAANPKSGSGQPDFGPNVIIFDPSMPTSQIQATVDAIASQQVDNEMGTQRYALLFKPGTYGSAANPAHHPGGLLHRGSWLGCVAYRRHHQRPCRRVQPVPDRQQLHRAQQLLALAVEPDDQRHGSGRAVGPRATSGLSRRPRRCGGSTSLAATSR